MSTAPGHFARPTTAKYEEYFLLCELRNVLAASTLMSVGVFPKKPLEEPKSRTLSIPSRCSHCDQVHLLRVQTDAELLRFFPDETLASIRHKESGDSLEIVSPYVCKQCSGEITWRRGVHFSAPHRKSPAAANLRGCTEESFTGLRIQKHQFANRQFKRVLAHEFKFFDYSNDYERQQSVWSEQGIDNSDPEMRLLTKENRALKNEMFLAPDSEWEAHSISDDAWSNFSEAVEFVDGRASHLEIGRVILTRQPLNCLVSANPPCKFIQPAHKCPHGIWVKEACRSCTPEWTPVNGLSRADWEYRLKIATENTCKFCGSEMEGWRQDYCLGCANTLLWQIPTKFRRSPELPNVEGASARFQEKKLRLNDQSQSVVPWYQVELYVCTLLPEIIPGSALRDDRMGAWILQNAPWLSKLLRRFWFYGPGGLTLQQIAEAEGVRRHSIYKYLQEHSNHMRSIFSRLGRQAGVNH